jgi:hypothetical protein
MVGEYWSAFLCPAISTQLSVTSTLPSFFNEQRFGQNKSGCKPRADEKMTHTTITPAPAANGVGHNFSFRWKEIFPHATACSHCVFHTHILRHWLIISRVSHSEADSNFSFLPEKLFLLPLHSIHTARAAPREKMSFCVRVSILRAQWSADWERGDSRERRARASQIYKKGGEAEWKKFAPQKKLR